MNDDELEILTGKCWACNAGLTALDGYGDPLEGFVQCECKPGRKPLHYKPKPKSKYKPYVRPGVFFAWCYKCQNKMLHQWWQCRKCDTKLYPVISVEQD